MRFFALPLSLAFWIAAAPSLVAQQSEIRLPEDPTAIVVEFDWVGGYTPPRKSNDPYLTIRADGSVSLINPFKNEPPLQTRMSPQALLEFVRFAAEKERFFDLNDAAVKKAAEEEMRLRKIGGIPDAPTTAIRIRVGDRMHQVRCFASMVFEDPPSKLEPLRRFVAVETRLTKYMDRLREKGIDPGADLLDPVEGQVVARLVANRVALSHGRADELRPQGYFTPFHKSGERLIEGFAKLAAAIAEEPDPRRISIRKDDNPLLGEDDRKPRIREAARELPSGMTLLHVELGDIKLGQSIVRWNAPANGTLYATANIPEAEIVAGMPLVAKKMLDAYVANSVVWEAPSFGNTVMPHTQTGGSTNVSLTAARGKRRAHLETRIGWADPMEMVLSELGQELDKDGSILVHLKAALPEEFEANRIVRWSAMPHNTPHVFGQANLPPEGKFTVRFAKGTAGLTQIRVVATPTKPGFLNPTPREGSGFFDTALHSRGPTLEDSLSVNIRADLSKTIQDALDKAKAKTGDVQVSLFWSSKDDVDLHVVAPSGEEIFYGRRKSKCGGELDVDMNVGYTKAVIGAVENVYWPQGKAPIGKYRIYVVPYSHHGGAAGTADPAPFTVRLVVQGRSEAFHGAVSFGPAAIRKKTHVHDFEVP